MFQKIEGQNIFSWEKLEYSVEQGISQITGFNYDDGNAEGSGKSSVLNTLCWTLYGEIPKDAKVDEVIRLGQNSCKGVVTCNDGTKICRTRKPNALFMVSPDGQRIERKDAKETQKLINAFLGMEFSTFCQVVYFSQSYYKKFISVNEADKAKILSEIQDLSIFDAAREAASKQSKLLNTTIAAGDTKLILLTKDQEQHVKTIELLERQIASAKARQERDRELLIQELESAVKQKTELENKQKQYNKEIAALGGTEYFKQLNEEQEILQGVLSEEVNKRYAFEAKQKEYDTAIRNNAQTAKSIERLRAQIVEKAERLAAAEENSTHCPTCESKLKPEQKEKVFKSITSLRKEIISLEQSLQEVSSEEVVIPPKPEAFNPQRYEELKQVMATLKTKIEEVGARHKDLMIKQSRDLGALKTIETNIEKISNKLDNLQEISVEKEENDIKYLRNLCTQNHAQIEALTASLEEATTRQRHLDLLKDGFKEIKSYVFQNLLMELSFKSTKLARALFEVPVTIQFSNDSEDGGVAKIRTEVTLDGQTRSLGLYSGGQYKRLELAVDLALSQIVANRSHKPMNFRIFDEPFKDLGEVSVQRAINLLKSFEGVTILIEHNPIAKSIVDRVFHVEYRNGVSTHADQSI